MQSNLFKKLMLAITMIAAFSFSALAQQITVKGTISDAAGPIAGATVIEKGTTNGTSTDLDGNFSLAVNANSTVEISCIGYTTQTYKANQVPSNINLVEDSEFLEETVVVGYGVQKKSNITGAIASVKSDALENRSNETVGSALQGKLAGVQVLTTSGAPGSSSTFRIRGFSSTNSSPDPLLIVDGLKVQSIDYLDPESVESIEVLKDAASAAIYGSQAGNGVVLITTKTGSEGNVRAFFNTLTTVQTPLQSIQMMNAQQFKSYWQEVNPGYTDDLFQSADTNWQDEMFENGIMQRYTVGVQGGNSKFSYYVDATYMNNDGIVTGKYDTNERITGQVNVSYQLKPWLKIGTNNAIERGSTNAVSQTNFTGTGSAIGGAYYFDPTVPVTYANDSQIPSATGLLQSEAAGNHVYRDENGKMYGQSLLMQSNLWNPLLMRYIDSWAATSKTWRTNVNGTVFADITPLKGLTITSRLGYRLSSNYTKAFRPSYWINPSQSSANQSISGSTSNQQYYQWENYANYLKTIGKHDFSVMAGMEFAQTRFETLTASANGVTSEDANFQYLSYYDPTASSRTMGGTDYSRYNMSYFGRFSYAYDNRYNVQASLRADAYDMSKLSKDSRWGFFPSVSAGWTISNEEFFKNNVNRDLINQLKVRASYGINGNINSLTDFSWTNAMSLSGLYGIGDGLTTIASPSTILANPNLTWEESRQTDLGIDVRMFNDRLSLGVDYYDKYTTNMLVSITAPAVSGASTTYVNRGKIRNNGVEFEASWKGSIGDFNYSISGNLATVHNMVVESPNGKSRVGGSAFGGGANFFLPITYLEEGYPMWSIRTYKVKGLDENGDTVYYTADELGTDDGRYYAGSGIPDFTYGLTFAASWKNFDFTIFGSGVQGNEMFLAILRPDLPIANMPAFLYTDRWTTSNKDAKWPRPSSKDLMMSGGHYSQSDYWVFDASYFKIKQIQLGYTMPKKVLDTLSLKGLRIYGSLENAFTFTKYPGNDPESMTSTYGEGVGMDRVNYPSTKNFILGVNLSF